MLQSICWSLILLALSIQDLRAADAPRRALVIGNSSYADQCRAATPSRNADTIAPVLTALDFKTTEKHDLDESSMRAEIINFISSLKAGDVAFIYYSGYAIQAQDDNWLLPVSFRYDELREIYKHAFGLGRVLEQMYARQLGAAILVFDANRACSAWPQTRLGLTDPSPDQAGFLLAFAAGPNVTVSDAANGAVNRFTLELVKSLKTPGLKPSEVFDRIQEAVRHTAGNHEIPVVRSLAPGDYYLTGPPPVVPPKTVIVEAPPKPTPGMPHFNAKDLMNYVWIPAGTFQMGCVVQKDKDCQKDESPQQRVTITGFWITSTEITLQAFERFTNATGHPKPRQTKTNFKGLVNSSPQTEVNWQDAQDYCKWAVGGRLPTEAQWEYAARGGKDDLIYPWGDKFDADLVNSFHKSRRKGKYPETTPVAQYDPNGYGLFDMIGNVREWVLDAYDPRGYSALQKSEDPFVQSGPKDERVLRGGTWNFKDKDLRTSARDHRPADKGDNQTGFRCVTADIH